MATIKGRIKAISISQEKGTQKTNVPRAELKADFGIIGDAHSGNWHRQVSLLALESIDKMIAKGAKDAIISWEANQAAESAREAAIASANQLDIS